MIRIHVICEGQTEEMFINEVLSDFFQPRNIYLLPSLIGRPGHKGGNFKFDRLFTDVRARLLGDTTAFCTTFFDFYALPEDFAGKAEANNQLGIANKAACLQEALMNQLRKRLGEKPLRRFIPYVQMYDWKILAEPTEHEHLLGRAARRIPFHQIEFTKKRDRLIRSL